jgi:hypothetical protein
MSIVTLIQSSGLSGFATSKSNGFAQNIFTWFLMIRETDTPETHRLISETEKAKQIMKIDETNAAPRWGGVSQGDDNENSYKRAIIKSCAKVNLASLSGINLNDAGTCAFIGTYLTQRADDPLPYRSPENVRRKMMVVGAALIQWPKKTPQGQALERPKLLKDIDDLAAMIRAQSVG